MRLFAFLLTLILVSGCGWQLRGQVQLPAEYRVLYLQSNASPTFMRQLKLQLEINDVVVVDKLSDAQAVLEIQSLDIDRRTMSVSSTGQVSEYELDGRLYASLKRHDREGVVLFELASRRYFTNDINNVLGTENVARLQLVDLEKDLAAKLLRRLQHVNNSSFTTVPTLEANQ